MPCPSNSSWLKTKTSPVFETRFNIRNTVHTVQNRGKGFVVCFSRKSKDTFAQTAVLVRVDLNVQRRTRTGCTSFSLKYRSLLEKEGSLMHVNFSGQFLGFCRGNV